MFIKSAKGDTPTTDTLFNGQSGNKMMDTINTERYSVISQMFFKMKSNPLGAGSVPNPFITLPGTMDTETNYGNRIGDKITPKGYSFKFMVELNERYQIQTLRYTPLGSTSLNSPQK